MRTRLTEEEVKALNLTAVPWITVREAGIEKVYIRAYPESPMYGPYKVIDANKRLISKLDGTEERYYPRDKGLFAALQEQPTKWKIIDQKENDWDWGDPIEDKEGEVSPASYGEGNWYTLDSKGRMILNPGNPAHTKIIVKSLLSVTQKEINELEDQLDSLYDKQELLEDLLDRLQ